MFLLNVRILSALKLTLTGAKSTSESLRIPNVLGKQNKWDGDYALCCLLMTFCDKLVAGLQDRWSPGVCPWIHGQSILTTAYWQHKCQIFPLGEMSGVDVCAPGRMWINVISAAYTYVLFSIVCVVFVYCLWWFCSPSMFWRGLYEKMYQILPWKIWFWLNVF